MAKQQKSENNETGARRINGRFQKNDKARLPRKVKKVNQKRALKVAA